MGVHLMDVPHRRDLTSVHLIDVWFIGVYIMGVHLMAGIS
jgi:hypothetical protein